MQLIRDGDGWLVRVPDAVVDALGLREGHRVTLRPVPRRSDEARHAIAQMRGRFHNYPFDREDWDGVDLTAGEDFSGEWEWSTKTVLRPERS